jgi:hypothetical protein
MRRALSQAPDRRRGVRQSPPLRRGLGVDTDQRTGRGLHDGVGGASCLGETDQPQARASTAATTPAPRRSVLPEGWSPDGLSCAIRVTRS